MASKTKQGVEKTHKEYQQLDSSNGLTQRIRRGISNLFYPIYNRIYDSESDRVSSVDKKLSQARVDQTPEMFLSRSIGYGILLSLIVGSISTILTLLYVSIFGTPSVTLVGAPLGDGAFGSVLRTLRNVLLLAVPTIVVTPFCYTLGFYAPQISLSLQISSREREINRLLSDTVSYMYALSIGGMNQLEIMEAIADSEDVYGELSKEFQSILNQTYYFDTDYRTAIRYQANETPSDEFSQFLSDMLSILSSGGDLNSFLDDKTETHLRNAKQNQEDLIEFLELFGEMYLNVSLLPLMLLILVTIMQIMGSGSQMMLYLVVYVLIPMIGVGFLVMMSTILPDEPGDGKLTYADKNTTANSSHSVLDLSITKKYQPMTPMFDSIHTQERNKRIKYVITHPQKLFVEKPATTLIVTVPVSLLILVAGYVSGIAPQSISGIYDGLWGTVFYIYIPMYLVFLPLTIYYYKYRKYRTRINGQYTEALRKLSSANDTGQTILESFLTVSETSTGRLSEEFKSISEKVKYDYTLKQAIVEFNNKYKIPAVARINNLIIDAQETSSQISEVLVTAAQTSQNQDELRRKRASRTRMQIAMLIMTYLILMGVIAMLYSQFIGSIAEIGSQAEGGSGAGSSGGSTGGGGGGGGNSALSLGSIDETRIGILFFHGVVLQAVAAGLLSSYLKSNTLSQAGLYILPLSTIALFVWIALM